MNFIELLEKFFAKIKKLFIRGFFTLLPIVATIVVITFICLGVIFVSEMVQRLPP